MGFSVGKMRFYPDHNKEDHEDSINKKDSINYLEAFRDVFGY